MAVNAARVSYTPLPGVGQQRKSQLYRVVAVSLTLLMLALVSHAGTYWSVDVLEGTSIHPLSTYQDEVVDIVKKAVGAESLNFTNTSSAMLSPQSDEEWEAWSKAHMPAECTPVSSTEVAPDGKVIAGDWSPDCSIAMTQIRSQYVHQILLARKIKSLELAAHVTHSPQQKEEEGEEEGEVQQPAAQPSSSPMNLLRSDAKKMNKLRKIRIAARSNEA